MAHDYEHLFKDDSVWLKLARELGPKIHDLVSFLEAEASRLSFDLDQPSDAVTVHRFCQSGNVLGHTNEMDRLLDAAGIAVVEQAEPGVCCGFGGSTSVTAPEVSKGISKRKLVSLQAAGVTTVVTDNPGCVLHLRGVVDAAGVEMEVLHPAEVLARRLRQR
jgi:Fe-S oxidoreductase